MLGALLSFLGFGKPRRNRRHLMGMSRSGVLIEDRNAFEVDEELISDAHKMAFDDDRQVPFYRLRQEGVPPSLEGTVHVYTGGTRKVTRDGWWLLTKAPAIYEAAATSITERKGLGLLSSRRIGVFTLAAGLVVFLVCMVLVGFGMRLEQDAKSAQQSQPVKAAPVTPEADAGAAEGAADADAGDNAGDAEVDREQGDGAAGSGAAEDDAPVATPTPVVYPQGTVVPFTPPQP